MTPAGKPAVLLMLAVLGGACRAHAAQPQNAQYSTTVSTADTEPATVSLESYISTLLVLHERLKYSEAEQFAALRSSLPERLRVEHHGQRVEVSFGWLRELLNNTRVRSGYGDDLLAQAGRRLEHMRDQAQEWSETDATGIGTARGRLAVILARSEFSKVRGPNWFDRLRARIAQWFFERILGALGRLGGVSTVGGVIMWSLIALALIVLALWGFRALRRGAQQQDLDLKGAAPEAHSWHRWAQLALAAAARGDYRAAVHHAYWAFIYRLEEAGTWHVDRARTHREYLRMLPPAHEHRAHFETLTRRFESVWYGRQTATAEHFHEAAASLEKAGCLLGSIPATGNS